MKLAAKLKALNKARKIQLRLVARDCLLPEPWPHPERHPETQRALKRAQERLSRWINRTAENWQRVTEPEFCKISSVVFRVTNMSGPDRDVALPIPDAMHFALASWLETGRDSLRDMRDNFPGIYTVYRHSLMEPDFVAIGRLTIEHDRGTGAFRTKEEYRVNKSSFEMHGYLFRKHGRHYILSRHIDQEIRIQFFYINAKIPLGPRDRKNERFSGMFSDIQDHRYYSGRFVCVRGKPKTVTVIPADKLPSGIFRPIEKKPDLVGYVASF